MACTSRVGSTTSTSATGSRPVRRSCCRRSPGCTPTADSARRRGSGTATSAPTCSPHPAVPAGALQLVGGDRASTSTQAGQTRAGRAGRARSACELFVDGRRLVRRPRQRPRRARRLDAQPAKVPGRPGRVRRRRPRARHAVRAVGRAGDGQPRQRPVPRPIPTGSTTSRTAPARAARNQSVLNLARPDVRDWVHATAGRPAASATTIDFVKWDMNRPFSEPAGRARRRGQLWFDHVRNLYAVLDRLRADHPDVADRVVLGRRRPGRHGHPATHRPGVDLRQHRRAGPAADPGGLQPAVPGAHDVVPGSPTYRTS